MGSSSAMRIVAALCLCLAGAAVSGLLLMQHHGEGTAVSAVNQACGDGQTSGCEDVARSSWSRVAGLPADPPRSPVGNLARGFASGSDATGAPQDDRWALSESPISTPPPGKYSFQRRETSAAVSGSHETSLGKEGLVRASISTGGSWTTWWRTTRVAAAWTSAAGSNRVKVVQRKFIGLAAARAGSSVTTTSGHDANADSRFYRVTSP